MWHNRLFQIGGIAYDTPKMRGQADKICQQVYKLRPEDKAVRKELYGATQQMGNSEQRCLDTIDPSLCN